MHGACTAGSAHIAQQPEAENVERDGFGRDRILLAGRGFALAEHERADSIRIAERKHAVAEQHRHHRVAADAARVGSGDRLEDMIRRQRPPVLDLQLVRKHVEQDLGIGVGIDMAAVVLEHLAAQLLRVDQVAVVRERDTIR